MNIVSVSWGDHLSFGEGEGQLETPEKLGRAVRRWRDELGAAVLHWRMLRARIPGAFHAAPGYEHQSLTAARSIDWDDFELVPELAHRAGLQAWLYVSLFDEGWPLASGRERETSYHNAMHGQHVSWQSDLTRDHPQWMTVDCSGTPQMGVISLAYPEARRAFIERWLQLLSSTEFDGLFVCLRSQSRPAEHADQFGFNAPIRDAFRARLGHDIRLEGPDVQAWRDLQGEYLTSFIAELRDALTAAGRTLGIGVARGDVLGPPLGNATLAWREWMRRGLVDQLVIDQNSSQCPSMWHQLWPMHRGAGYLQNYLDGAGLPPLVEHVAASYGPVAEETGTKLFLARQWSDRDAAFERELCSVRGVAGLVFSSFRHDNPDAIRRGNWQAGKLERSERASSWLIHHQDLLPPSGRALDVACGRGRNALWLAERGFEVRAVDRNEEAIRALAGEAAVRTLSVDAVVRDLETGDADLGPGTYDLIVVFSYLHRPLFPALIAALAPGGVLVYETFTTAQASRGKPTNPDFLLKPGELRELVRPLEILAEREGDFEGKTIASVIARRSRAQPRPPSR